MTLKPGFVPKQIQGLGLLELLLSIAVAAVLLILSVSYYLNVRSAQKVDHFLNQAVTIRQALADYLNQNTATPANIKTLFEQTNATLADYLVKNNILSETDILNVWAPSYQGGGDAGGGEYYLGLTSNASSFNPTSCLQLQIQVNFLPSQTYCANIIKPKVLAAGGSITCATGTSPNMNVEFCLE